MLTVGVAMSAAAAANAAPPVPRDPDWPCQQIKVPELSLAAVWSGPQVDLQQSGWKDDRQVADMAEKLSPRREPLERAGDIIHDFARQTGNQKVARLTMLLAGIHDTLDTERNSVIAGLDRFGRRQKELAEGIRSDNAKLQALQAEAGSDPNAILRMTQQVAWEVEVFQDRRQAISYACDAPTKIEQRLFALAHLIQQELE
jgi:hypothetical protein